MRMMHFPPWLQEHLLEDAVFREAYQQVSSRHRAWTKTCISQLHAWYGETRTLAQSQKKRWRSGFTSVDYRKPLDWVVVFLNTADTSPVRLLAAFLPALFTGVNELAVVRYSIDKDMQWPSNLIAALEFGGLEAVASLNDQEMAMLTEYLSISKTHGAFINLSPDPMQNISLHQARSKGIYCWQPGQHTSIGVWYEPGQKEPAPNLEMLSWAHPDTLIDVWWPGLGVIPAGFQQRKGNFDDFINSGYSAVFAPPRLAETIRDYCPLLLGPGNEGCWLWPDLSLDFFQRRSVYWTTNE